MAPKSQRAVKEEHERRPVRFEYRDEERSSSQPDERKRVADLANGIE